jgi:energy-coupling factor transporter transmembrane protein EcfT
MMTPPQILGWTLLGVILMIWHFSAVFQLEVAVSIILLGLLSTRRLNILKFFLSASAPFLLPLLIMHGLLNAQFPIDAHLWIIPYRLQGLRFALYTFCDLAVLLALASAWSLASRDDLLEWLASRQAPIFILGILAQSIAMLSLIERRSRAVLKAQTARGIRTGPEFIYRVRAYPSIVLPVITSLINESGHRATALWSRGFLEYQFAAQISPFSTSRDIAWIAALAILAAAARTFS